MTFKVGQRVLYRFPSWGHPAAQDFEATITAIGEPGPIGVEYITLDFDGWRTVHATNIGFERFDDVRPLPEARKEGAR